MVKRDWLVCLARTPAMRILVADDNKFVRRGICGLLAELEGCEVCGEASDSAETIQEAIELRPDVILLDVSMPGQNGLETAAVLRQKIPAVKILIITQHDPKQILPSCLEVGANGCVDKARLSCDLLPAIRGV
jgi:two-component system, NarL family, response regulator NreC